MDESVTVPLPSCPALLLPDTPRLAALQQDAVVIVAGDDIGRVAHFRRR